MSRLFEVSHRREWLILRASSENPDYKPTKEELERLQKSNRDILLSVLNRVCTAFYATEREHFHSIDKRLDEQIHELMELITDESMIQLLAGRGEIRSEGIMYIGKLIDVAVQPLEHQELLGEEVKQLVSDFKSALYEAVEIAQTAPMPVRNKV